MKNMDKTLSEKQGFLKNIKFKKKSLINIAYIVFEIR